MANDTRLNVIVPAWLRDQAHAKAQADATDVSRIVRRLVFGWLREQVDVMRLPDPPASWDD